MTCSLTEKVSLLIDGAMTPEEAAEMKDHLSRCGECREAKEDFIRLGTRIKSYTIDDDPFAERQALWRILTSQKVSFWRRRVALPVPAVAIALAIVLALGAWSVFLRQASRPAVSERVRVLPAESPGRQNNSAGIDLSRFDHGQRAVIYKVRQGGK